MAGDGPFGYREQFEWDEISLRAVRFHALAPVRLDESLEGVPAGVRDSLTLSSTLAAATNQLILKISGHVWHQEAPTQHITKATRVEQDVTVAVPVPDGWWQHWRHDHRNAWWYRWAIRRWPVRTRDVYQAATYRQTVTLTVPVAREIRYPELQLPADSGRRQLVPMVGDPVWKFGEPESLYGRPEYRPSW